MKRGSRNSFSYANRQQIPLAVLVGSDEFVKGK